MAQTDVKHHYLRAWPLIVFSVLAYFITSTVASSMNVAATILEAERGWDSVLITSMISVASVGNVVFGFAAGKLCTKYSAKLLCCVWAVLYLAGVAIMGISPVFGVFAVSMIVANAASSAWGYNTVPVLLTNWFPTRKGTVQGFVSMGIPLGAGFASMVYNFGYQTFGINGSFLPFLVVAGVALVLLMFGITDKPEQKGLEPDTLEHLGQSGQQEVTFADATASESANAEISETTIAPTVTTKELLRNKKFMLLSAVLGIQLLYSGGLMVQLAPRIMELGYSMDEAIMAMLVSALFACVGSFICGRIGDVYGSKVGTIISFTLGIVAILCNVTGTAAGLFISLALIGVVTGGADNWPVNICAEVYGREGFSAAFGLMLPIIQLVGSVGPALFALISGATGSYVVSYLVAAALMLFGLIAFLVLTRDGFTGRETDAD